MRACQLIEVGPIEAAPLQMVELPTPVPGEDELLIRVRVCGICRTDLHVIEGELPPQLAPLIPGHQVVGEVAGWGSQVQGFQHHQRVGVPWLHRTCGQCHFCVQDRENLCNSALFTGWTAQGGFAEFLCAPAAYVYALPEGFADLSAAPLLCAGIIGYRCLRLTGLLAGGMRGARLGLYGFGAAGHVVLQIARARGAEVYVCTRDRQRHQALAEELGAHWVGASHDTPPVKLDASIIFAPAGELVPPALRALDKGGVLVLGGIHMSPLPAMSYELLYQERSLKSVANNTRADGREFLAEAARIPIETHVESFSLESANLALHALKRDAIKGAAVLRIQN